MFELNPLLKTDAWWQHLLMLLVAAIIGYIIGYITKQGEIGDLESQLAGLDADLDNCQKSKKAATPKPVFIAPPVVEAVAPVVVAEPVYIAPPVVEVVAPPIVETIAEVIAPVVPAYIAPVVAEVIAPIISATPDDLKIVEGIGPKIEELLNNEGILTFVQLAATSPERIKEVLVAAGSRFQMHDPGTWPAQSNMAAEGRFDELKVWQDELNKGKE